MVFYGLKKILTSSFVFTFFYFVIVGFYLTAVHVQSTGEFSTGKTLRAMNVTAYRNAICFHRLSFRIGITSLQWHGKSRIAMRSLATYTNCVKANRPTYPYRLIEKVAFLECHTPLKA